MWSWGSSWAMRCREKGAVKPKEIEERIKQQTQKLFGEGPKEIDRRFFPERSNDEDVSLD